MEIFKDVVGYEGLYQVSNFGRVKSLKCGREKILKPYDSEGYTRISLHKSNKRKDIRVHIMVALAHIGARPEGLVIDHIDENKSNNNVSNLRYITSRENVVRSKKFKTSKYTGVSHSNESKINPWYAQIKINSKTKNLGRYKTELEASNAYQAKLKEIGE
jgi:hypothetical protein